MKLGQGAGSDLDWAKFVNKYRHEMANPEDARTIELLAVLARESNFSVGCYCEDEERCHRSVLRMLLEECGAVVGT